MVRAGAQLGPRAGAYPLVGEADPKARAASLVGRGGSWGLWLQGPGGPGVSACSQEGGVCSWVFWWIRPCPREAMESGSLKASCLLVGGAVSSANNLQGEFKKYHSPIPVSML